MSTPLKISAAVVAVLLVVAIPLPTVFLAYVVEEEPFELETAGPQSATFEGAWLLHLDGENDGDGLLIIRDDRHPAIRGHIYLDPAPWGRGGPEGRYKMAVPISGTTYRTEAGDLQLVFSTIDSNRQGLTVRAQLAEGGTLLHGESRVRLRQHGGDQLGDAFSWTASRRAW